MLKLGTHDAYKEMNPIDFYHKRSKVKVIGNYEMSRLAKLCIALVYKIKNCLECILILL